MNNVLKTCCLFIVMIVFQETALSQRTYLKRIETSKTGWNIFVYSSNNQPVTWEPDSLILSKFDNCGEVLWQRQYRFPFPNRCLLKSGFKPLKDGKFIFVTTETYTSKRNSRVTLVDANGNVIWSRSFNMTNSTMVSYSVMQNSAGDFYIYGNKNPLGGGPSHCFVYKIGLNGAILWTKSYSIGGIWGGAILTSDQGLLLRNGLRFIKISSIGSVQWATSIMDLGNYFFAAPIEVSDGYIFTGANSGTALSLSFFKLDKLGQLPFIHKKTISLNSLHRNLVKKSDTSFICILNESSSRRLPTIVELDHNLNIIRKNTLHLSGTPLKLTGTGVDIQDDGTPLVAGVIDSLFNNKPFFGVLNSKYELGCDTTIADSIFIETVTQTFPVVTSQNLNPLVVEDSSYSKLPLYNSLRTMCEAFNFALDIGDDTIICPNSSLIISNKSNSKYDQFTWSTGEITSSISVNNPGAYSLSATNSCTGTTRRDTILVSLYDFPIPVDSSLDTIICNNEVITLDAQIPSGTYRWQDNSTLSYYVVYKPGNYFVDVTSNHCTQRFFYTINGCEKLFIPNVFSPNGDNLNDLFTIDYKGFESYHLLIYNRWGQLVFESNDKDFHWDGKLKTEEASEATYFYVLKIGEQYYKGNVSVFR